MAQNYRDFVRENQTEPVMTTVGRGMRDVATAGAQAAKNMGRTANQAPKLIGTPAAAVANVAAGVGANFMTGFTGKEHVPNAYEGKSFTQLFGGGVKPAAAAPAALPTMATPAAAPAAPTDAIYTLGAGLPSAAQIASDKSRATASQTASDMRMGVQPSGAPAATSINVQRQANGVLAFSGSGGGDGTGAVNYNGLPSWTSARGGAGQGSADFGGQAFKPAQAALAKANDPMTRYSEIAEQIASGAGGAVGVAQNKIALAALAPLLERQMANENSTGIAKIGSETTRRGQDLGLKGEMARVDASIYGTDVGAQTARETKEVEKERNAVALSAAKAKASGNPLQVRQAMLLELEWSAKTGLDPNSGLPISEAQRKQYEQRILAMKTPQTVVPYGGYGMAGDE